MPLLSSSIVKHQLASMEQVEEALARQSTYGGDLLTHLLELQSLSEERVSAALSESFGLDAAPVGELPRAPEHVRRLVPLDVTQRFACYPLEEQAGVLVLAVSEPLPSEVENDLGFGLGVTIVQRVAPLVRVRQAVARDYGQPLDERTARALARLEGRPVPSSVHPAAEPERAERPPTIAPPAVPSLIAPPERVSEPAPPPHARTPGDVNALVRAVQPEGPRPRRVGPYTAAMAERDLFAATSRDEVLESFFDFVQQYFEYSALFALHGDLAEGRDAHGPGAPRAKVQSIGISLELPSSLAAARDVSSHLLTRLAGGGLDSQLAKDLERRPGPLVLLLPIRVRGRTILVLYGDHGDADVDLTTIGDVISFVPLVATTLERLIVQRKRGRAEALVLGSLAPKVPKRAFIPSPEERAQALAAVLTPHERPPPFSSAPPPVAPVPSEASPFVASSAPPLTQQSKSLPPAANQEPDAVLSERPAAPAALDLVLSDPPPREMPSAPSQARARPLAPVLGLATTSSPSNPPRSIAEALARPVIPIGRVSDRPTDPAGTLPGTPRRKSSLPPHAVDAGWEEFSGSSSPFSASERGTRPGVGSVRPTAPPASEASSPADGVESPDVSIAAEPIEDELAALATAGAWADLESTGVPLAPSSRTAAHSARPLPPPRSATRDQDLPSVIVDVAEDCKALLEQLLEGDVSAGDRLVAAGAPGIAVLVAAFPGPIEVPSSRKATAGLARASDCGPVMRTLARIGERAVPFLVVRTNDGDPEVRGYATRLLGEIPGPDSAHAIARRFFDSDAEVRRSALAAARLLASTPDAIAPLVAELGGTAEDRMRPTTVRLSASDTLAELRQPQAVPHLVRTLEDNPVDIVQSARRALVVLARQDFGIDAAAWRDWWRSAAPRHRIEWLIDALTHEAPEIRRAAGDELKALTREYFGYYDDLPATERAAAQRQYRHWWETRGKARFRG
jgi:hypothetical protein